MAGLAALAPAFAQTVDTGLEVRVNPVSPRGGVLLYPGGEYSRQQPTLLYPGERSGPIRLQMPTQRRSVARAARSVRFPARFVLVGATNPCPCGYRGDAARPCRCTPLQLERYQSRLSGPLRDRLDLTVEVPAVPPDVLSVAEPGESSAAVRSRVVAARHAQLARNQAYMATTNATLTPSALARGSGLDGRASQLLSHAVQRLHLTARGYDRVRKVARTIADLAGSHAVSADHVGEALQFRLSN